MKIKKHIFAFALCMGSLTSCVDLDIPPMNIVGDNDIFGSTAGVTSYMARLYSTLPVEDFRYSHVNMFFSGGSNFAQPSCLTGEAISRDTKGAEVETANYWDAAYALIRETNYFIETLPKYADSHSIIRKSKFPQNPKRSVRFSGKRTKRSVQKRKARNTQKAETKVL